MRTTLASSSPCCFIAARDGSLSTSKVRMSSFLPREWGERGALRVSEMREPARRTYAQRSVQRYIRENFTTPDDLRANANARALRAVNRERVAAAQSRMHGSRR